MTAATVDLVDAKDEAVKAGLRLDMAQAVSDVLIALKEQGAEFRIALEKQGRELASAVERQNATIERQNATMERQNANLERRLAIATYWLFGLMVAGHAATISIVISLVD